MLRSFSTAGLLFVCVFLPINSAWAKTYRVLVVSSSSNTTYKKVIDVLQSTVASSMSLSASNADIEFNVLFLQDASTTEQLQRKLKKHDLLLTIGQRAMLFATQINRSPPILATLIPKQSYLKHRAALRKINKKTTAVFIDNLPSRQIQLAKAILGRIQKLGVLIGESPLYSKKEIKYSIKKLGIKSHIEQVKKQDNLIQKLSIVLTDSDALIAIPDAQVFNRNTAKNILLTTYRHRTPVIAYSASYVKAGALAAVYSTPKQIAEQTAHTLVKILTSSSIFPNKGTHPQHFNISINRNVAKSLGIPVASEKIIKSQLLKTLGGEQ